MKGLSKIIQIKYRKGKSIFVIASSLIHSNWYLNKHSNITLLFGNSLLVQYEGQLAWGQKKKTNVRGMILALHPHFLRIGSIYGHFIECILF